MGCEFTLHVSISRNRQSGAGRSQPIETFSKSSIDILKIGAK